jgi:2-hydroxychromene-2-carboxylate isomerase
VQPVELYFDFVSPYAYLALTQVESFGRRHGVSWELKPVVYGALLDATGLVGPAEVEVKRRYTLRDVLRTARLLGEPLVGPPAHPFRSLEALRTVVTYAHRPEALALVVALARAGWGEGRDLTDVGVLRDVVADLGLDGRDLEARLEDPATKRALRCNTDDALAAGVFGVPTFRLGRELFWGHDRMDQLAARLAATLETDEAGALRLESRPRGADRRAQGASPEKRRGGDGGSS